MNIDEIVAVAMEFGIIRMILNDLDIGLTLAVTLWVVTNTDTCKTLILFVMVVLIAGTSCACGTSRRVSTTCWPRIGSPSTTSTTR